MSSNVAKRFGFSLLSSAKPRLGHFSSKVYPPQSVFAPPKRSSSLLKCKPWSRSTSSSSDRSRQTWASETFCVASSRQGIVPAPLHYSWCGAWTDAVLILDVPLTPAKHRHRALGCRGSGWCWDGASAGSGIVSQEYVQANDLWLSSKERAGCAVRTKTEWKKCVTGWALRWFAYGKRQCLNSPGAE